MDNAKQAELFGRLANLPIFRAYLEHERDATYKYLASQTDHVGLHRAQGKVLFIEKQLDLLDKSK